VLLLLAFLPRVGGGKKDGDEDRGTREERGFSAQRVVERESADPDLAARRRATRTQRDSNGQADRDQVVAPADGTPAMERTL